MNEINKQYAHNHRLTNQNTVIFRYKEIRCPEDVYVFEGESIFEDVFIGDRRSYKPSREPTASPRMQIYKGETRFTWRPH